MRVLHTSDWHLGHRLGVFDRDVEHEAFLDWLLGTLESEEIDTLLIAGDVYESANPPAEAERRLYRFLVRARERRRGLDIVLIGGNHDSAARLDALQPVLQALGIHVVGGLPSRIRSEARDRLVLPLAGADGSVSAWVAAVPFLRQSDLDVIPASETLDPVIEGVRRIYAEALELARSRRTGAQALIAMGHCYMTGGQVSDLSERKILLGNQHALPADIFPADVTYVALGHLHRPQPVGGRPELRYSGSPLPLSMAEIAYLHQVVVIDTGDGARAEVRPVRIPRVVDLLRLPAEGSASKAEVLELCRGLPPAASLSYERRPFLEVTVRLDAPEPRLREEIAEAIEDRAVRLVRIRPELTGSGQALAGSGVERELSELAPEEVFHRRWARSHAGEPPPDLVAAFNEVADEAGRRDLETAPATGTSGVEA